MLITKPGIDMSNARRIFVVTFGLFLILGSLSVFANMPTPKAKSPVSISIQVVSPAKASTRLNTELGFVISASVEFSTNNLEIQVSTPPGMILKSGALNWNGRLAKGDVKLLKFTAGFSTALDQNIEVIALLKNSNNANFAARAEYIVNEAPEILSNTLNAVSQNIKTVPRGNGTVIEYALP